MKVQIDIVDKVKKGDLLIFDGRHFVPVSKDSILRNANEKIDKLEERVKSLEDDIKAIKGE